MICWNGRIDTDGSFLTVGRGSVESSCLEAANLPSKYRLGDSHKKFGMQSKAKTVKQYLDQLPADRRDAISAVRDVMLKNLPKGFEEGMQYGMIGYFVPHSVYPAGYHCNPKEPLPYASLASQKNYMSIYLMCIYGEETHREWFIDAWKKAGKKLDMGKSCVRFKKLEDVPLKVVGQAMKRVTVKKYIDFYEGATNRGKKK